MKTQIKCHIRWLIRRDMPEVLAIENGSNVSPWGEEEILRFLRQRNGIGMVAEYENTVLGDKILGFMLYELHKSKLTLIRMGVSAISRRMRVGTQLMEKLMSKLSSHRRTRIVADVSENDFDKHLFFRAIGWEASRVLRGDGEIGEDVYRFVFRVPADTVNEEEFELP